MSVEKDIDKIHKEYIVALQKLYNTTEIEYIASNDDKLVFFVKKKVVIITKEGEMNWSLKTIN